MINFKPFFAGVIGADVKGCELPCENFPLTSRLAVICGTSTCHMAVCLVWSKFVGVLV